MVQLKYLRHFQFDDCSIRIYYCLTVLIEYINQENLLQQCHGASYTFCIVCSTINPPTVLISQINAAISLVTALTVSGAITGFENNLNIALNKF